MFTLILLDFLVIIILRYEMDTRYYKLDITYNAFIALANIRKLHDKIAGKSGGYTSENDFFPAPFYGTLLQIFRFAFFASSSAC